MIPYDHARLSVRDFGGEVEDYLSIHEFLDSSKFHVPNYSHRAILHNSFGMQLAEQVFGSVVTNSEGKTIGVREIARRHIIEDCGKVPTLEECIMRLANNGYHELNKPNKKDIEWLKTNT